MEAKHSMVNFSSFWRGPSPEAASLHTYLLTGKWDAPPGLSGASIPMGENVDPEPSHRLISPTNLTFPFSPFSITPLLQPLIFLVQTSLPFSVPPLFLSFKGKPDNVCTLLYSCVSEEVGDYQSEERSWRRVTYLYQKSNFTCLDQGWVLK